KGDRKCPPLNHSIFWKKACQTITIPVMVSHCSYVHISRHNDVAAAEAGASSRHRSDSRLVPARAGGGPAGAGPGGGWWLGLRVAQQRAYTRCALHDLAVGLIQVGHIRRRVRPDAPGQPL